MTKTSHMTDSAALATLGERIARHRLDHNRTQAELAREAGVSKRTLIRLELGESTQLTNLVRVLRVLGLLANLDAFVPAPAPSPMEQLKREGKKRRRASRKPEPRDSKEGWSWGDDSGGEGRP